MNARSILCCLVVAAGIASSGCDDVRRLVPPAQPMPAARMSVHTFAAQTEMLELPVDGERQLGPMARRLGTTVEDLVRDNHLTPGQPLQDGTKLKVRATRPALTGYVEYRLERKRARLARIEAKAAKRAAVVAEKEARKRRVLETRAKRKARANKAKSGKSGHR